MAESASKRAAFKKPKKKKKKVLKQKQNKKSVFKLKAAKKSLTFPHRAVKPKKAKVLPEQKRKRKPVLKPKPAPKPKTKAQNQARFHYAPHSKIYSSGYPSVSESPQPQMQPRLKIKSKRTTSQNENFSQSGLPPKSKTHLKLQLDYRSKQKPLQYQNMSLPGTEQPKSQPTPRSGFQSVWDTSVQAAIRVGDWKLLTGDPGHGDWVPLQVPITFFRIQVQRNELN